MTTPTEVTPNMVGTNQENPNSPMATQQEAKIGLLKTSFFAWGTLGHIFIAMIVVIIVWWGLIAPLASAVVTSGFVTVDTNRKSVSHLEGGVVKALYVRNGSHVNAGDPLISLDETQIKARYQILGARKDETIARIARLETEIEDLDSISFPEELTLNLDKAGVKKLINRESKVFKARRLAREGERDILSERLEQTSQEIEGLKAELAAESERKEIATLEHENLSKLYEDGLVNLSLVLDLKRELAQLQGNIGRLTASIASSNRLKSEIKLQIVQGQKEFNQTILGELTEAYAELKQTDEELTAAKNILDRIVINSPVSGTVVNLSVHSKGAVVRPGDMLLEVVPDRDDLLIEVRVEPQDIDNIRLKDNADVRFTAFKQRTTPLLTGIVTYVSPDRNVDDRTGSSYYSARIAVGKTELDKLGDDRLAPGMPADVMIETGSRTAVQYLAQPIIDSMNRAWREE